MLGTIAIARECLLLTPKPSASRAPRELTSFRLLLTDKNKMPVVVSLSHLFQLTYFYTESGTAVFA